LVTGGAGFIGSHVAEQLLAAGHEVAIVDDLSSGKRENVPPGAQFVEADIRTGCEDLFASFRPDVLSHHAAQMDVRRSVSEPDLDADINVIGTLRLLQNCVRHEVRKVIFASSGGAIYGEQTSFPATEEHQQYPVSPYGVSKLAGERYLYFYSVEYGLAYVALRYANVYGPRQDPHGEAGVVAIFGGNLRDGAPSTIYGTGEQTRDYIYVEDVARANLAALDYDGSSGAFNVGTGIETTVTELYDRMRSAAGSDVAATFAPARPGEQSRSSISPARAKRELGWEPEVGIDEGLSRTLRSIGLVIRDTN
jgi:UDP-glucose 4-epimerase